MWLAPARHDLLLVGGDVGFRAAVATALEGWIAVGAAGTASEALSRLDAAPALPDLVILDIPPSDHEGTWLVPTLLAATRPAPAMVVTGPGDAQLPAGPDELRIIGMLRRPPSVSALLPMVATLPFWRPASVPFHVRPNRHLARAFDCLSLRYGEPLAVETVARAAGVSASHLGALARTELRTTVRDLLTRVRVEVARYALRTTDDKLDALAERLGFCDASHLSRVFRDRTGLRPGEYRRAIWVPGDARGRRRAVPSSVPSVDP